MDPALKALGYFQGAKAWRAGKIAKQVSAKAQGYYQETGPGGGAEEDPETGRRVSAGNVESKLAKLR